MKLKKLTSFLIILLIIGIGLIIYNYLLINSYNFSLKGSSTILLNIGDTWNDPLYSINGNKNIIVTDNINYQKEGEYQVNYTLKVGILKKSLARKVYILNNNKTTNFIFNLKGDNPYYLMINHPYVENGYDAYDVNDGYLNKNVIEQNNINNAIEGKYNIKYQVKNSDGITKTITREVIVYSFKFDAKIKTEEFTKENEISLNIKDANYEYTILPNNDKTFDRIINYQVLENGSYKFKMYDKNYNELEYKVNIANIDNEKPTGTCVLTLTNNSNREINVIANDNNKIKGYIYQYGTVKTDLLTTTKYTYKSSDKKASVIVYDTADNYENIECSVINKIVTPKPTVNPNPTLNYATRSYTMQKYNGVQYALYKPSSTINGKIPLVLYYHGGAGFNVGLPTYLNSGSNFPFYIVCPKDNTDPNFAISLINNLSKTLKIDTKRIYVSGASAGTKPAMITAYQNKGKFRGVIILASFQGTPTLNAGVPMWFFQGSNDSYNLTKNIVNRINASGGNAKLTIYQDGGHDSPLPAFKRQDLINWILKK